MTKLARAGPRPVPAPWLSPGSRGVANRGLSVVEGGVKGRCSLAGARETVGFGMGWGQKQVKAGREEETLRLGLCILILAVSIGH